MADVPDNKKAWSLIKKIQDIMARIEAADDDLQALKIAYQNANPDVNSDGFPLSAQEVSDANSLITGHATYLSDFSTTITMLKSKNVGSHKGNALE